MTAASSCGRLASTILAVVWIINEFDFENVGDGPLNAWEKYLIKDYEPVASIKLRAST